MAISLERIGLIAAGLYLASKAFASYAYDNFQVVSAKIKLQPPSYQGITGKVVLTIENKTDIPVTVQSLSGRVLYNNSPLAQYLVSQTFTIQPKAQTSQDISFFVPYADLSATLTDAITSGQFSTFATIEGSAKVGGVVIPFSYPLSPF